MARRIGAFLIQSITEVWRISKKECYRSGSLAGYLKSLLRRRLSFIR
jgi:hypothetical protein